MLSTVIKSDGVFYNVEPRNYTDFQLDELKEYVGGYIEIIHLSSTQVMVVDEEGKIKNKPYNHNATLAVRMAGIKDVIVGDVLVCDISKIK